MVLIAIVAVYVALFVYYVQATMIGEPYWDMFSIITRYLQYQRDGNLWAYLWEPHVQHRQVWMRLLTAFDARVFSGIAYPFVIAAVACQAMTAWLLWRLARRSVPGEPGLWLGCLVLLLVLTSVAAVDCAIPMNGIYPQTVMFAVLSLVLLAEDADRSATSRRVRRLLAVSAAIAAAFANAAALALWPILLWIGWRSRIGRTWMTGIAAAGLLFSAAYLYRLPGATTVAVSTGDQVSSLLRMADYLVTYLGLPWTRSALLAPIGKLVGALLLVAGGTACVWGGVVRPVRSRLDRIAIGLVAFALATAVLAAIGRSGIDADLRVPVRYSVLVALLHVGLLFLSWPRILDRWPTSSVSRMAYGAAVAAAIALTAQQVASGRAAVAATQSIRATLERFAAGEETDDMKSVVYIDLTQARRDLDAIHAAGLYQSARDRTDTQR